MYHYVHYYQQGLQAVPHGPQLGHRGVAQRVRLVELVPQLRLGRVDRPDAPEADGVDARLAVPAGINQTNHSTN